MADEQTRRQADVGGFRSIGSLAAKAVEQAANVRAKSFTNSYGCAKNETAAEGVTSTRDGLTRTDRRRVE